MTPEERQDIESKKMKLRLFILLLMAAFFAYIFLVRPALKAAL